MNKLPCICELAPTPTIPFAAKRSSVYDRLFTARWQAQVIVPRWSTRPIVPAWVTGTLNMPTPTGTIMYSSQILKWQ